MTVWQRLIIYITESDRWQGQPLYLALVETAKKQGISGATVIRGIEGFGMGGERKIHTARILELSSELPILVLIVDSETAIADFLPIVKEMVTTGLVTLETLNVVHHALLS